MDYIITGVIIGALPVVLRANTSRQRSLRNVQVPGKLFDLGICSQC